MASIHKEVVIAAPPSHVWAAIRDFGSVERLVPGFLVECRLEAQQDGDARIVTFADGRVARELLVDLDDRRRRLVYAEPGGRFITRNASIQVFDEGQDGSRVVWIIDVLPNEFSDLMARNMDKATEVMKRTLEGSARS
jgi:carbon monoxide dehydrogenase subunit G